MLFKMDLKQLEWRTYLEWSRDSVGIEEVKNNIDMHEVNQKAFKLPSRLIAKKFLFRWIYRGSAWAYASDPDFMSVSKSKAFWQKVIDAANEKYNILYSFQESIINKAIRGEEIVIPTGRGYFFKPRHKEGGEWHWDISTIVNWPNQGFAADLMTILRVILYWRVSELPEYRNRKVMFINTVHDDIEIDVDNNPDLCYNISMILEKTAKEIPNAYISFYNKDFVTPMEGEIFFGDNLSDLKLFNSAKGKEQFL